MAAAKLVINDAENGGFGDENRPCCHVSTHVCSLCDLQRAIQYAYAEKKKSA